MNKPYLTTARLRALFVLVATVASMGLTAGPNDFAYFSFGEFYSPGSAYAGTRVYVFKDVDAWLDVRKADGFLGADAGAAAGSNSGELAAGDSVTVSVNFTVDAAFTGTSIINNAEIVDASETDNGPTASDQDSPLDMLNDGTNNELATNDDVADETPNSPGTEDNPNDEDDYDAEEIVVVQPMCDLTISDAVVTCAFDAVSGQSVFSVAVSVTWDYDELTTANESINVTFAGQTLTVDPMGAATGTDMVTFTNVTEPGNDLVIGAVFATTASCLASASIDLEACTPACTDALGGNVFNDFDNDGADAGAAEAGQANVLVEIYECDDPTPAYTTITNANGDWTVPSSVSLTYPVRVEFSTPLQDYLQPSYAGTDNGTNSQVVDAPTCEVDYGVINPDDFCQTDPTIAFTCFVPGARAGNPEPSVGTIPFAATMAGQISADVSGATYGSLYGAAYARTDRKLYSSAFLKRHVDTPPDGLGAVYVTDYSNASPVTTLLVTVPNTGTVDRSGANALPASMTDPSVDANAFDAVGKVGLGDIDVSSDGQTLYTVNLNTRNLVIITNLSGTPTVTEMPIGSAPNCNLGVFRPLGTKVYEGKVYVGGVCTGENGGGAQDISASVHEFNPQTGTWASILDFILTAPTYNHGDVVSNPNPNLAQCTEWEPWADVYTERNLVANTGAGEPAFDPTGNFEIVGGGPTGAEFRCRAQAMLADIDFTVDGYMLLSFMDRTGHQFGYRQHPPTGAGTAFNGNPVSANNAGDMLIAYDNAGTWTLETNGQLVSGRSSGGTLALGGAGNNEGPAGGEFFFANNRAGHADADAGGIVHIPGTNFLVGTVLDPNTSTATFGGGLIYYDVTTGNTFRNDFTIIDPTLNVTGIGKANGIGDVEAFCDPVPIQIGNYVWIDTDKDGVQDPCEDPVTGLPVTLYTKDEDGALTEVATTTTDATTGEYYFNDVIPDTTYLIVFGDTPTSDETFTYDGTEYAVTQDSTGEGTNPGLNDSDATLQTSPLGNLPSICYTTSDTTDHTLDVGLVPATNFDLALKKTLDGTGPFTPGDPLSFTIKVYNQGEVDAFAVEVTDYVPTGLTWVPGGDFTGATPETTVASIVAGDSATLTINFTIAADAFAGDLVNYAEITAADDDNIPDNTPPRDQDSTPGDNEGDDETGTDDDVDDEFMDTPGTVDNPNDSDDYDPAPVRVIIDLVLCEDDGCSFIIDFETDENGDPLVAGVADIFTDQPYANVFGPGEGLRFSTDNQGTNPLNLYDTDGTGGNDPDLEINSAGTNTWTAGNIFNAPIGNVLIINQTTDLTDPNDFANGGEIIVDSDRPLGRFAFEMVDLDFPVQGTVIFTNTTTNTSVPVDFADFEQGSGSPFEVPGVVFGDRTANRVISATADVLGLPFFDRVVFDLPSQSGAIGVICATVNQKFDLALVKRLNTGATPGPFLPGSTVTFELAVYNQGGEDAVDIVVKDYLPAGLSLAPASAPDWAIEVDTVVLRDSLDLAAGDSTTLSVSFVIDADFMGDSLINRAEIAYFDDDGDPTTEPPTDNDSTPGDNGNDPAEADTPDEYDDENPDAPGTEDDPNDEDDYDWEGIPVVQSFDLALVKRIDLGTTPGPFTYGSEVAFTIEVKNQGSLDATDVEVADYIPEGLSLVPSVNWTTDVDTARLATPFDLAAGATETLSISFTIDLDFAGDMIDNVAEITAANNALGLEDEDSTPGDNGNDDPEVNTDDEEDDDGPNGNGNVDNPMDADDFDLARVSIETVSLGSTVFLDNNNDGFQNGADTGIVGVEVQLFDAATMMPVLTDTNGVRVLDAGDAAPTVTDTDGNYHFTNLLPGDYYVVIPTTPTNAPISSNNAGIAFMETDPDDNLDNDDEGIQANGAGTSVSSDTITLALGDEPLGGAVAGVETAQGNTQDDAFDSNGNMTLDFGFFAPVSVGDTAFVDLDGDGLQTLGEPGIGGVTVALLDSDGDTVTVDAEGNTITGVTTTDPDGSYGFDNLPPGSYAVAFDISTADNAEFYNFTMANAGDDTDDSDNSIALSDSTAQSAPTPFLNSGEEDLTLDVGIICAIEVTVADPFTICATGTIDLLVGASVTTSLGGTWSTPDGTGTFVDANGDPLTEPYELGTAAEYLPSSEDARRGSVTLILTSNEPAGPCDPVSNLVTIEVLKVDCGQFMWDGN